MMKYLVFIVLLFALPMSASAQLGGEDLPAGVQDEDVYRVSREMYCEVCAGVPISACPSPTCRAWRQEIANLLGEGYSDDAIMEYFAVRYGEEVTGIPLEDSDRTLALGLPLLVTILGAFLIVWQVWRLRGQGSSRAHQAAQSAGLNPAYARPVPDNVDEDYLNRFLQLLEKSE